MVVAPDRPASRDVRSSRDSVDSVRMFGALLTASVGRLELVTTSSFSLESMMRAAGCADPFVLMVL